MAGFRGIMGRGLGAKYGTDGEEKYGMWGKFCTEKTMTLNKTNFYVFVNQRASKTEKIACGAQKYNIIFIKIVDNNNTWDTKVLYA